MRQRHHFKLVSKFGRQRVLHESIDRFELFRVEIVSVSADLPATDLEGVGIRHITRLHPPRC